MIVGHINNGRANRRTEFPSFFTHPITHPPSLHPSLHSLLPYLVQNTRVSSAQSGLGPQCPTAGAAPAVRLGGRRHASGSRHQQ